MTVQRIATYVLLMPVRAYQYFVSPLLGPRCRFQPSCSDYAVQSLHEHGPLRGTALSVRRLCKCHPWHSGGYDPVPPTQHPSDKSQGI